jgi:hypothetical protein
VPEAGKRRDEDAGAVVADGAEGFECGVEVVELVHDAGEDDDVEGLRRAVGGVGEACDIFGGEFVEGEVGVRFASFCDGGAVDVDADRIGGALRAASMSPVAQPTSRTREPGRTWCLMMRVR